MLMKRNVSRRRAGAAGIMADRPLALRCALFAVVCLDELARRARKSLAAEGGDHRDPEWRAVAHGLHARAAISRLLSCPACGHWVCRRVARTRCIAPDAQRERRTPRAESASSFSVHPCVRACVRAHVCVCVCGGGARALARVRGDSRGSVYGKRGRVTSIAAQPSSRLTSRPTRAAGRSLPSSTICSMAGKSAAAIPCEPGP